MQQAYKNKKINKFWTTFGRGTNVDSQQKVKFPPDSWRRGKLLDPAGTQAQAAKSRRLGAENLTFYC